MTSPTNIYNYILENHEAIDSIPSLVARLAIIEDQLANLGNDLSSEFNRGDHDELFAVGGATVNSWSQRDWAELFESPNI